MLDDIDELVFEPLGEVILEVQEVVNDAQEALDEAREDSIEEIDEFEDEKRNLTVNHFTQEPEDIGFALLADDVNRVLYAV
ncbi:MAG: hypothetical protein MI802_24535 [Desulfobacterales bacterium]|nr:hypothetical protein [Desulfobacterales bacterium]